MRDELDQLSVWSRLELDSTLRRMLGSDLDAANATAGILSVKEAAESIRARLPRDDGRGGIDNLRRLCEQLARLYRRFGGLPLKKLAYPWIACVVTIIDPEVTESNLSTALRDIPWRNIRKLPPE